MKKIALLFTLTLVGTGVIRGMEQLPKDIHHEIVRQAIESSNTLEEAIKAVNVASALQGVNYDNLKDFTRLVHMLADKFNTGTYAVSKQFKNTVSKLYNKLAADLSAAVYKKDTNNVIKIIKQGVDVNYSTDVDPSPALSWALTGPIDSTDTIKLLFDFGLNPPYERLQVMLNQLHNLNTNHLIREEIKQMLQQEAKKKQQ